MTTLEHIRLYGQEFDNINDETVNKWIDVVKPMVSRKKFGDLYDSALALLTCHKMKLAGYGVNPLGELGDIGIGFSINSVSEGGSSISFGANQTTNLATDAELGLTAYGVQYLQIRRSVIMPILTSGGID